MKTKKQIVQAELPVQSDVQVESTQPITDVNVTLSKAEEKMLSRLSPQARIQARADILASKKAERIAYLNDPETQARLARAKFNRTAFRVQVSKDGKKAVIYGMGNRFPFSFYKRQWELLNEHSEEIDAVVETLLD